MPDNRLIPAVPADPPTPGILRSAMRRHGLSRSAFARLAGAQPRAVQRWLAEDESLSRRDAPRGLWHLLSLLDADAAMTDLPARPPSAEEIRGWLDTHKMTQAELAEAAGVVGRQARRWVSKTAPAQAPYWLWHVFRSIEMQRGPGGPPIWAGLPDIGT